MNAPLSYADIDDAAHRITGRVRPVPVAHAGMPEPGGPNLYLALEQVQHTGTFKARGAQNFLRAHLEAGSLPRAGVTIASGGNAGMANAWAAGQVDVPATVFVPASVPQVKIDRLRDYGADVRLVDGPFARTWDACDEFAEQSGALKSHAYDDRHIAAGAGTLLLEILEQVPGLDTVVVAVGGGGLFSGVQAVAAHHGIRTVAAEPVGAPTLHAALEAGRPVDIVPDSVAADSLGGKRVSQMAFAAARHGDVRSVVVPDARIVAARRTLWDRRRLVVEHAAGTALAGIRADPGYRPAPGEKVCVVLCGANTDPSDLA